MRKLAVRQAIEYGVDKAAVLASVGPAAAITQVAGGVITPTGWLPDWFGDNARSTIGSFLQPDCVGTSNFGCFESHALDHLISQAESAPTIAQAATLWHQADMTAMRDAAIVPLIFQDQSFYSSARVHQYCPPGTSCPTAIIWLANVGGPDITNVWLSGH